MKSGKNYKGRVLKRITKKKVAKKPKKKDITIQNMVASGDLFVRHISLEKIVKEIENTMWEPEQFPGLCLKLQEPKVSILIFSSGRIVVAGAKSRKMIELAVKKLKKILRKVGIKTTKKTKIKINNIVASGNVGFTLNLEKIVAKVEGTEYNPEEFPGLVYKIPNSNLNFLLFNTGRIVCVGAKREEDIIRARKELIKLLKKIKSVN